MSRLARKASRADVFQRCALAVAPCEFRKERIGAPLAGLGLAECPLWRSASVEYEC